MGRKLYNSTKNCWKIISPVGNKLNPNLNALQIKSIFYRMSVFSVLTISTLQYQNVFTNHKLSYLMNIFQYWRYLLHSSKMFSQIKSYFIEWVLSPSTVVSNFTVHCIKAVNVNLPFVPLKLLQNWQNLFSTKNHQQVGRFTFTFLWTEIAIATVRSFVAEVEYF